MSSTDFVQFSPSVLSQNRSVLRPGLCAILPRLFRVDSYLPNWKDTLVYFLATPELGARFAQAEMQISPGGGTQQAEGDDELEYFLFVLEGELELQVEGKTHNLAKGGYMWSPPGVKYEVSNKGGDLARAVWFRKLYDEAPSLSVPGVIVDNEQDVKGAYEGTALTQHLVPFEQDRGHDLAFNILSFAPSVCFDLAEAHIFEHGAYFLTGRGLFWIAGEYYDVRVDDFVYFAPYVPHFACCQGEEALSYLLYKNVNRDVVQDL